MRLIAKHFRFSIARNPDFLTTARLMLRRVNSFLVLSVIARSSRADARRAAEVVNIVEAQRRTLFSLRFARPARLLVSS